MNNHVLQAFIAARPRLLGVAYRLLGCRAEAEDLVQDAFLRWSQSEHAQIDSPLAFLITVTKRLALDRLREAKRERESCAATWDCEDASVDPSPSPEMQRIRIEDVSEALVRMLERLGSDERTAFLLREVFDYDYPDVARLMGKAEPACRQLVHRARTRVREATGRFVPTAESCRRARERFLAAIATADPGKIMALLSESIEYTEPPQAAPAPSARITLSGKGWKARRNHNVLPRLMPQLSHPG